MRHPAGVADIVAHVPSGYDPRAPIHLVVFFHGSDQCIAQLALSGDIVCKPGGKPDVGAGVAWRHDDAGTMSLFAAPQLTLWGGGTAGRFAERGYMRTFLEELLGDTFVGGIGGPRSLEDIASITLVGHSAGYLPVLEILRHGEWDEKIESVVLLDALFNGGADVLAKWIEHGLARGRRRKLVAVYGAWGQNVATGHAIATRIERLAPGSTVVDPPGGLTAAARAHVVTVKLWRHVEHAWMLLLTMSKALAGLDLPPRPVSPPSESVAPGVRETTHVARGETRAGAIDVGDERLQNGALADELSVSLDRDERITLEARGGPSLTEPCCSLDVVLRVSLGTRVLQEDDDSGGGFDSRLELVAPVRGTYSVRVSTYGAGERRGPYTFRAF
ncbi:MAG: hypothetical protein M3O50_22675 [Myxococcota bacterium]|nr:hypothetical protein [Myxococcota bacterium]